MSAYATTHPHQRKIPRNDHIATPKQSPTGRSAFFHRKREALISLCDRISEWSKENGNVACSDRTLATAARQLAIGHGGLIEDEFRKVIWPVLAAPMVRTFTDCGRRFERRNSAPDLTRSAKTAPKMSDSKAQPIDIIALVDSNNSDDENGSFVTASNFTSNDASCSTSGAGDQYSLDSENEESTPVPVGLTFMQVDSQSDYHSQCSTANERLRCSDDSSPSKSGHTPLLDGCANGNACHDETLLDLTEERGADGSEVEPSLEKLKSHREWSQGINGMAISTRRASLIERQVERDVYRTLARFPPHMDEKSRTQLQDVLTPLVIRVLWKNEKYQYYQGFHDILLTLLLVMGEKEALEVGSCLAEDAIFRRFLCEPLDKNAPHLVQLIYVILAQSDVELERYMRRAEVGTMFGLSWLLTWFAHNIDTYDQVVRLYDLFLASHALMPIYFGAALVLWRSDVILNQCECDMPQIHSALTRPIAEGDVFPLESLIADAQDLFCEYPPSALEGALLRQYTAAVALDSSSRLPSSTPLSSSFATGTLSALGLATATRPDAALRATVWAATAAAAVWYLYVNYARMMV